MKQAISVTLESANITWLKGRLGTSRARSISELLDQLIAAARTSGSAGLSRSVVGTLEIDNGDPNLARADAAVRALLDASMRRPSMAKAPAGKYRVRRSRTPRRG